MLSAKKAKEQLISLQKHRKFQELEALAPLKVGVQVEQ